jgi:ADP-ribosylglycohydrolase
MRITWIQPEDLLVHELRQSADEGKDVTAIAAKWAAAGGSLEPSVRGASEPAAPPQLRILADDLLAELAAVPDPGSHAESDEISRVLATTPGPVEAPRAADLRERLHGGWLGRAAGCLLGKPVEKIPRHGIREILESSGRWPLRGYFTARGLPDEVAARWPWNRASAATSLAEVIDGMPEDDDLNYPLIALDLLERHGPEFGTEDVAAAWLALLPAGRVFTAERAAYRNLLEGLQPPETATVRNPYREWIGAQIRGDVYGWACPGDPHGAAALAVKDARLSHTRNGIYGAMYVAAMTSAACVTSDVGQVLDAGSSVLPPGSRLAAAVREARTIAASPGTFENAVDRLQDSYGQLHWVHVLNNAALVTLALAAGGGDFVDSICLVVSGGWDTDSNGATVGSITGTMCGAAALPEYWTGPLRNRLASSMPGFDGLAFDALADRTLALSAAIR